MTSIWQESKSVSHLFKETNKCVMVELKRKKKDLSSLLFCLSESLANLLNFGKLCGLLNWSVKYYLVNLLSEINTENRTLIHFKVGVYHGILLVFDKQ